MTPSECEGAWSGEGGCVPSQGNARPEESISKELIWLIWRGKQKGVKPPEQWLAVGSKEFGLWLRALKIHGRVWVWERYDLICILRSSVWGTWVAQWLSVCLWLRAWSWGPGIESHIRLSTGSLLLPLPLSLPLSLSLCLSWINKIFKKKKEAAQSGCCGKIVEGCVWKRSALSGPREPQPRQEMKVAWSGGDTGARELKIQYQDKKLPSSPPMFLLLVSVFILLHMKAIPQGRWNPMLLSLPFWWVISLGIVSESRH